MRNRWSLQVHAQEPASLITFSLEQRHAFSRFFQVSSVDVPIEFNLDRALNGLMEPLDHGFGEPMTGFPYEVNVQIARLGTAIRRIGQHDPLKSKLDHSLFRLIGQVERTLGMMEVIGVVRSVFCVSSFHTTAKLAVCLRRIKRQIPSRDIA